MFKLECTNMSISQTVWKMYFDDSHEIYFSSCLADCIGYSDTYYLPELSGIIDKYSAEKIIAPFVLVHLELFNKILPEPKP